jgi:crotonobetainyl-CoA:carnitine CoA-transferase CaiB-like acyl-CoA transferase
MLSRLLILFGLIGFLTGCGWKTETKYSHYVHRGEKAHAWSASGPVIYIAAEKELSHQIEAALAKDDKATVESLVASGKVTAVPVGTLVDVTEESFNERRVTVTEGPLTGKTGWCPVERLKPPQRGDQ